MTPTRRCSCTSRRSSRMTTTSPTWISNSWAKSINDLMRPHGERCLMCRKTAPISTVTPSTCSLTTVNSPWNRFEPLLQPSSDKKLALCKLKPSLWCALSHLRKTTKCSIELEASKYKVNNTKVGIRILKVAQLKAHANTQFTNDALLQQVALSGSRRLYPSHPLSRTMRKKSSTALTRPPAMTVRSDLQ